MIHKGKVSVGVQTNRLDEPGDSMIPTLSSGSVAEMHAAIPLTRTQVNDKSV